MSSWRSSWRIRPRGTPKASNSRILPTKHSGGYRHEAGGRQGLEKTLALEERIPPQYAAIFFTPEATAPYGISQQSGHPKNYHRDLRARRRGSAPVCHGPAALVGVTSPTANRSCRAGRLPLHQRRRIRRRAHFHRSFLLEDQLKSAAGQCRNPDQLPGECRARWTPRHRAKSPSATKTAQLLVQALQANP